MSKRRMASPPGNEDRSHGGIKDLELGDIVGGGLRGVLGFGDLTEVTRAAVQGLKSRNSPEKEKETEKGEATPHRRNLSDRES